MAWTFSSEWIFAMMTIGYRRYSVKQAGDGQQQQQQQSRPYVRPGFANRLIGFIVSGDIQ